MINAFEWNFNVLVSMILRTILDFVKSLKYVVIHLLVVSFHMAPVFTPDCLIAASSRTTIPETVYHDHAWFESRQHLSNLKCCPVKRASWLFACFEISWSTFNIKSRQIAL